MSDLRQSNPLKAFIADAVFRALDALHIPNTAQVEVRRLSDLETMVVVKRLPNSIRPRQFTIRVIEHQ